jgi:hypothetical protein
MKAQGRNWYETRLEGQDVEGGVEEARNLEDAAKLGEVNPVTLKRKAQAECDE